MTKGLDFEEIETSFSLFKNFVFLTFSALKGPKKTSFN